MQKRKIVVWGGLTDSCEKKRTERQRIQGKIYPSECRATKNKERKENLPKRSMQGNRGNNRMGKTRDFFKKSRDTKGTFHAKFGTVKDRNSVDLMEAEEMKRWQAYTELYRWEESRRRRNRTGRPLSVLQIHRKNNGTVNKVYKTTSDR